MREHQVSQLYRQIYALNANSCDMRRLAAFHARYIARNIDLDSRRIYIVSQQLGAFKSLAMRTNMITAQARDTGGSECGRNELGVDVEAAEGQRDFISWRTIESVFAIAGSSILWQQDNGVLKRFNNRTGGV